ncbi:LLM class F420-dependent oxidoreductase [Nocardiopsis rhodophaea]|uniref:LLM class F420-dependent oxidoreductase n=1 Tax=Nocardiopsis rhodophaea TaxID=280238 RepID=A0ABN2TB16_9ACTN
MTSSLSDLSVLFPDQPLSPNYVCAFAELVKNTRARRLWLGQSLRVETHQMLAYLAGAGLDVPVGTSVTLMPLRHPYEAGIQARSVAALTGQPTVAGFGASTPAFVRAMRGEPYSSPRTAAREYLSIVRDVVEGRTPDRRGEYHVLSSMPVHPLEHPPVEIGAGVLRPGMARTAGEVADVAITWMTPPDYVRDILVPALKAGAAGKHPPPRVATVVHAAVDRPGRNLEDMAHTAAWRHLRAEHYTDMLRQAGVMAYADDPEAGAREILRHGVFVTGSPEEIANELARYRRSGVDEVIVNPAGVLFTEGLEASLVDLAEILAAAGGLDD